MKLASVFLTGVKGERDDECGALTNCRFHLNLPLVSLYHLLYDGKPKAGSFTGLFGSEERIEDVGEYTRSNAGAGVLNPEQDMSFICRSGDRQRAAVMLHGVEGIEDQI